MDEPKQNDRNGIAALFDAAELKGLFIKYVHLLIIVEIILFLMVLAAYAAERTGPFPTKLYLFLAFGTPLAITFLLGVVVQAFGDHLQGERRAGGGLSEDDIPGTAAALYRAAGKSSFLVRIVLLLLAAMLLYHLGDLFGFVVRAGSRAYEGLLLVVSLLIGGAIIAVLFWMLGVYRLKNKQMDQSHQYRQAVLDRLDLIVLDDHTLVDRRGRIIPTRGASPTAIPSLPLAEDETIPQEAEEESRRHDARIHERNETH